MGTPLNPANAEALPIAMSACSFCLERWIARRLASAVGRPLRAAVRWIHFCSRLLRRATLLEFARCAENESQITASVRFSRKKEPTSMRITKYAAGRTGDMTSWICGTRGGCQNMGW